MAIQTQVPLLPYHAYRAPLALPPYVGSLTHYNHQQHHHNSVCDSLSNLTPDAANFSDAYMNPTLPQPPPQYSFQPSPRHGIKRSAPELDDEFERSSHISTQFKKLRLNNQRAPPALEQSSFNHDHAQSSPQYTPSDGASTLPQHPPSPADFGTASTQQSAQHPPVLPSDDFMTVDDTPHKIYISDLDSEIAAIEAAEHSSSQLFLPDFEKQIGAIPDHVLRSNRNVYAEIGESSNSNNQALVLYREPSSLSVPEEHDAVRKVVQESRRGMRERLRREQQKERETAHMHLGLGGHGEESASRSVSDSIAGYSTVNRGKARYNDNVLNDGDAMDFD